MGKNCSLNLDVSVSSTQALKDYHVQASDGITGHVCDFLMDDERWVIDQFVVKIGHRFTGKEVWIPARKVDRISYEESTVFVHLTKDAIAQSPAHDLSPFTVVA